MLSHEEEQALAAMEAQLREENPDLHALFDATSTSAPPTEAPDPPLRWRGLRVLAAVAAASATTALVTVAAGPSAGGLVGALSFPMVGLYGWSLFGCPGHQR